MLILILLVIFTFFIIYKSLKSDQKYKHLPGPDPIFILGNVFELISFCKNLFVTNFELVDKYGPIFKLKILFWHVVIISEPQAVKKVFVTNERNYTKDNLIYHSITEALGESILSMLNVAEHKKLRTVIMAAFSYSNIKLYFPIFVNKTHTLAQKWMQDIKEDNNRVEIEKDFSLLALDIVGRIAFASDFNALQIGSTSNHGSRLHDLIDRSFRDIVSLNPIRYIPYIKHLSFSVRDQLEASKDLSEEMRIIIDQKRKTMRQIELDNEDKQKDILDILVGLKDENGDYLEDKSICDQSKLFLAAGFETTSAALSFIIYLLSKYPDVQSKLAEELLSHFPFDENISMDSLDKLQYLNNVIKEALRMYPPGTLFFRTCVQDDTLSGHLVPAGTVVFFNAHVIQNCDSNFPNPSHFDPDRWNNEETVHMGAYFPFIHGSRNCMGSKLALVELKAILLVLIRQFIFSLPSDFEDNIRLEAIPTMRTSPPIHIIVNKRQ